MFRPSGPPPARRRDLEVLAHPGAREDSIRLVAPELVEVAVRARAFEGRANDAILECLARALGLAPTRLRLAAGVRGRRKRITIEGMGPEEALALLRRGMESRSSDPRRTGGKGRA